MSQSRSRRSGRRGTGKTESPEVRIVYRNQLNKKTAAIITAIVIAFIAIVIIITNYFNIKIRI